MEQLQNLKRRLQCVKEMVVFLEEILFTRVSISSTQSKQDILKNIWHIEIDAIDREDGLCMSDKSKIGTLNL